MQPFRIISLLYSIFFFCSANSQTSKTNYLAEAQSLYNEKKYTEVILICDKQIALHTRRDEAYRLRGKANMDLGNLYFAIEDFTQSLRFDRINAETYALRAWCNYNLKEFKLARLDYIEACYLDSANSLFCYNLGNIEQHMFKLNEALKSYSRAIQLNPFYVEAYKNRGYIHLNRLDYQLALQTRHI